MLATCMEIYCVSFPFGPKGGSGVASLYPLPVFNIWSHTFAEFYHEITFKAVLPLSSDTRRVVASYKQRYVPEVLVSQGKKCGHENRLSRLNSTC